VDVQVRLCGVPRVPDTAQDFATLGRVAFGYCDTALLQVCQEYLHAVAEDDDMITCHIHFVAVWGEEIGVLVDGDGYKP
jgi:hypothetical protein